MSHIFHDPDEWETVTESRPCWCVGVRPCNGTCNGMVGVSERRREPEEVVRIKADRLRKEEDEILARADAIRERRALGVS